MQLVEECFSGGLKWHQSLVHLGIMPQIISLMSLIHHESFGEITKN